MLCVSHPFFDSVCSSGGKAKFMIAEGHILVNGNVETGKRKKIASGNIIESGEEKFRIKVN